MRSAKPKRARQSWEAILAVEGAKDCCFVFSPRKERSVASIQGLVCRTSNGPKQQGPPAWIDRYQWSSASECISLAGSPIHVNTGHSLGLTPLHGFGSSLGYNTFIIFQGCIRQSRPDRSPSRIALRRRPNLITYRRGSSHDTPRACRSCILRRIH